MQIRTTVDMTTCTLIWLKLKKTDHTKCWPRHRTTGTFSYTASGKVETVKPLWKTIGNFFSFILFGSFLDTTQSILSRVHRRNTRTRCRHKDHIFIYGSVTCGSPNVHQQNGYTNYPYDGLKLNTME